MLGVSNHHATPQRVSKRAPAITRQTPVMQQFSPHQPAGQRVAACLTAHCACPHHLPCLLDVGGGEGLRQGREDPSGSPGKAGREAKHKAFSVQHTAQSTVASTDSGRWRTWIIWCATTAESTNVPVSLCRIQTHSITVA